MTSITKTGYLILIISSLLYAQTTELPDSTTSLFAGSRNCNTCHTPGFGPDYALTDSQGNELTPSKDWRSTMMANSAKDPYWLAKVEAEVNENPQLKEIIEDKCSTCHMPMGRTQAKADGAEYYSITEGLKNELAMDGVSCTVCHQIQPTNLGQQSSFSGGYIIDSSRVIYGPYDSLNSTGAETMTSAVQFEPAHGPHMLTAGLCATCHTLYTSYVDDNGEIAGIFPEQMPYFEWKASSYALNDMPCQSCHVPRVDEDIAIAWLPGDQPPRNPIFKHQFVGGNTFMLTMLKENGAAIGVTAESVHFDSTIAHTRKQLQTRSAEMHVSAIQKDSILQIDVTVANLTGHKFPTGYPGRRAWLHVTVSNSMNDTIFESGAYGPDGHLVSKYENYIAHFDTIENESDTQIYEAVMGDVNGQVTRTLLRAATYLKDNRLPPVGFSELAERYEDIAVKGLAVNDKNFNNTASGQDSIYYLVDITGQPSGDFHISAELLYQSVNPLDIVHLRSHDTERINTFLGYYDQMINQPEIVQSSQLSVSIINTIDKYSSPMADNFHLVQNFPNPFNANTKIKYTVWAENSALQHINLFVYNILGQKVATLVNAKQASGTYSVTFNAENLPSGIYLYRLESDNHLLQKKMLLLK